MAQASEDNKKRVKWKSTLLVCVVIILVAGGLSYVIRTTEPTAQQSDARKRTPMLVEVTTVSRGTFRPQIVAMGLVQAQNDVRLRPRVSGEIVERAEIFEAGRFVRKGDMLVKIDPADYENAVAQRLSALNQAQAELDIEEGRQTVAKLDFELLDADIAEANESLVLRKPQLESARANVEAADAQLQQARIELERTTLRAPFDAQVLSRNVAVGSQVAPGDEVGRLVEAESYLVTASLPLDKLSYIDFASENAEGSLAKIRNTSSWENEVFREGRVDQLIGALDEETRLGRVNIVVSDPLARLPENEGKPPLIIGSLLEVTIEGRPLDDVVRLNRDYLREQDTVWVKEDGGLKIVPVTVRFRDATYAYISEGLADDAEVVMTSLSSVKDGADLRVSGETETRDAE